MFIGMTRAKLQLSIVLFVTVFVLFSSLFMSPLASASDESARITASRQVGIQLLDVGYEQYKRGMYDAARLTLEKASKYRQYFSVSDASKFDELMTRLDASAASAAAPDSPQVSQEAIVIQEPQIIPADGQSLLTQARSYSAQGRYDLAKQSYASARDSGSLTPQQQAAVVSELDTIARIEAAQNSSGVSISEPEIIYVDNQSVNNEYIEFAPVDSYDIAQTEQYPMTTETIAVDDENAQSEYIEPSAVVELEPITLPVAQPQVQSQPNGDEVEFDVSDYALPQAEPLTPDAGLSQAQAAKQNYIEVVKQKKRIQQSYTKAVVDEAVAKAQQYVSAGEFARAKEEIATASTIVEKNKLLLEEQDLNDYRATLSKLSEQITAEQSAAEQSAAEKARAEAKASQERLRSQQSADREKRITDLLSHANEFQKQQKYEEALAQIETLLAIDPSNRQASRDKQMLEDILNLRRQLELKKEMGKEEENLYYDNQKSMIPHAELMTYPKNWQDIAAKRDAASTITGVSPADAAVYDQLNTIVDLSMLTADTPLDEAVEVIKNSVDPALKLVVRWRDLEDNAYVERDTVIAMQGLSGIPVGKGLTEILKSVSGGIADIDYVVDDGIITIATKESLPNQMITNVYDITELIGEPSNFRAGLETEDDARTSDTDDVSSDEAMQDRLDNAATIMQMIQDTISPMSWLINGGEGTISNHGNRLVITQTPRIHEQIQKLLMEDLRRSLGHQVSIEARFLFVSENFLEDIGLDMSVRTNRSIGNLGTMTFNQGSYALARPSVTGIAGSLADVVAANPAVTLAGGTEFVLDNLTLGFFLRATQAHSDSKMLTAPRVTVLSGESAYIRVTKETAYVSDYDFEDITASGEGQATRVIADPETETVTGGVVLNVTPTISADNKYVILEIGTNYTKTDLNDFPVYDDTGSAYNIQLPTLEVAEVRTRVSVPDGGTLLLGGQKLGAEVNKEAGVPGMSKLPLFGRLFSNRSKVKDQDILLILVKPTIILQEEAEREYFAPLE